MAVAKVEELTRQLEELRRGRVQPAPPSAHELDKLRRELMVSSEVSWILFFFILLFCFMHGVFYFNCFLPNYTGIISFAANVVSVG